VSTALLHVYSAEISVFFILQWRRWRSHGLLRREQQVRGAEPKRKVSRRPSHGPDRANASYSAAARHSFREVMAQVREHITIRIYRHIHTYIYIYRDREREREREIQIKIDI